MSWSPSTSSALPDATLRSELVELLAAANQINAAIAARVASFDTRGLADDDACRTTAVWLRCYGRYTDGAASRMVKQARVLRELPAVAEAAGRGDVTAEHVDRIAKLAKQVGVEAVPPGRPDPGRRRRHGDRGRPRQVCNRIRDYVDPDGPEPMELFEQRELTLSQRDGMVAIRGLLDPDGGAAVLEALDSLMRPPGPDDLRTPGQRRADALVDLARRALAQGNLPTVGGMRPQVGILITPETLLYGQDGTDPRTRAHTRFGETEANRRGPGDTRRDEADEHEPTGSGATRQRPRRSPGGAGDSPAGRTGLAELVRADRPRDGASGWCATPPSGGSCSTRTPANRWTSAAPTGSYRTGSAAPSTPAIAAVVGPAARPRHRGPTPITSTTGTTAASPASKTCS